MAAGRYPIAALTLVAAFAGAARADDIERITDYRSDVRIARDGTIAVHEAITVNAQGDFIVHGIYRDFPTIYAQSGNVHVRFDVERATLDGRPTPVAVERLENGRRVRLGDADATLKPGLHRFVLDYLTDRQIAFGRDSDRFAWNVTGNGWNFAIDQVTARIVPPPDAQLLGSAFQTGAYGAQGGDAVMRKLPDGTIAFETTRRLDPGEGLTVAVTFAKGAVAQPGEIERWRYLWRDNQGAAGALMGFILLLVYFAVAWRLVGRDPNRGPVVPLFAPPHGLSPAAMRYIHRMAYDRKAFAATLIGLAVKGALTITETPHLLGPRYGLTPAGPSKDALLPVESHVAEALFGFDDAPLELGASYSHRIAAAVATLKRDVTAECEGVYIRQNRAWFWPGLGLIGLSCLAAALLSDDPGGAFLVFLWGSLFAVATGLFAGYAVMAWRSVLAGPGARAVHLAFALLRTLVTLPFAAGLAGMLFFLNGAIQPVTIAILFGEALAAVLFLHLLRAPTLKGGRLRGAIDGFALFLKTAETPRLETLQPPEMSPQMFERFLPYAIALDCENAWSRKFAAAMIETGEAASGDGSRLYMPMWYQGDSLSTLGTSAFVSSLGASIGDAAAAASVAPSSGSGGGSFSGSGGGGGGGGGW